MNFLKRNLIWVAVMVGLLYPATYGLMLLSNAYSFGKRYIMESKMVAANLGRVRDVYLLPYNYSWEQAGGRGHAEFEVYVSGEARSARFKFELESVDSIWQITGFASI